MKKGHGKEKEFWGKTLCLVSGGQDSITSLHWALRWNDDVEAVSFNYGQRNGAEVGIAETICREAGVPHYTIDMENLFPQIVESAMFNTSSDISEITNKGVPAAFVPNRNQLFITLAHALAQKLGAVNLVIGVSQEDYSGYPDCREQFIQSLEATTNLGSGEEIRILTPLMHLDKADTFKLADKLGVIELILKETLTCYEGDQTPNDWGKGCGVCPSCKLRENGYKEYCRRSKKLQSKG